MKHLTFRAGILFALLVGLSVVWPRWAAADTIADVGSLEHLMGLGVTGVNVGNVQFHGFDYIGTTAPLPAPTAAEIEAGGITAPQLGLSFSASWESGMAYNQDSLISYSLHVSDTTPQQGIGSASLWFNGTSLLGCDGLSSASVTETIMLPDGTVLGQLSVFADNNCPFPDVRQTSLTLPGCYRDLYVTEDISLHSSQTGLSTLSVVDGTFGECTVPLPRTAWAGLGLLATSALAMACRRRRGSSPSAQHA